MHGSKNSIQTHKILPVAELPNLNFAKTIIKQLVVIMGKPQVT